MKKTGLGIQELLYYERSLASRHYPKARSIQRARIRFGSAGRSDTRKRY